MCRVRAIAGNAAQSFADMPKVPVGIVPRTAFVGGAAGQTASENVPEPYKNLVNVGANLAAGGGLAAAETAVGAGGRAAGAARWVMRVSGRNRRLARATTRSGRRKRRLTR